MAKKMWTKWMKSPKLKLTMNWAIFLDVAVTDEDVDDLKSFVYKLHLLIAAAVVVVVVKDCWLN